MSREPGGGDGREGGHIPDLASENLSYERLGKLILVCTCSKLSKMQLLLKAERLDDQRSSRVQAPVPSLHSQLTWAINTYL